MSGGAGHTPGPWDANPAGRNMVENYSQSWAIGNWPHQNLIAGCFSDGQGGEAAAKANALLIAAAPELLEHLERALNVIASWKGGLWLGEDAARAAIAKARGQ